MVVNTEHDTRKAVATHTAGQPIAQIAVRRTVARIGGVNIWHKIAHQNLKKHPERIFAANNDAQTCANART